jgi:hypothetical protein
LTLTSAAKAYTTYSSWGTLNVSFYVNPSNLDVSASAATSAVQAGMDAWNTQSGTAFRFNYAGQVSTTTTGYDNKNVVVFRNQSNGSTIASTYVWTSNGLLRDADIVFWDGGRTFFTGAAGCASGGAYIEDIATHELGHALGLQHSSSADATMYSSYSSCSTGMRTLSADDVAGAQALYAGGAGEADTAPTVTILAPGNGATASSTTTVNFSGSATDTTDGNISSKLVWRSTISGQIGTGASFSRKLPAGSHTITAKVVDSIGYTTAVAHMLSITVSTTPVANTAPAATIASPANGATVTLGTSTTFTGSASDTEEGNLTSSLVWRSNLDGQIGTGGSFTRTLTAGTHTITATVTDSGGLTTQRGITVSVAAAPATNTAPVVTIASPPNGATATAGIALTFSGSASDTQQGNLTSSLVWRSNLAGQIGTGGSFTRALTAGTHTITAAVTDSGGLTAQRSITVSVTAASVTQGMLAAQVSTIQGVKTVVLFWAGVTGTNVDVYRNSAKVASTANDGSMADDAKSGSYTYKVCAVGTSTCTNQVSVTF